MAFGTISQALCGPGNGFRLVMATLQVCSSSLLSEPRIELGRLSDDAGRDIPGNCSAEH
jgi:hypothetical protein